MAMNTTFTTGFTTAGSLPTGMSGGIGGQQIGIAAYFNPQANPADWDRLIGYPTEKLPILIANVASGPDSTVNAGWEDAIDRSSASGKTVLGYVRTGYLGVSSEKFTTRLGSTRMADWMAQIEADVDMWYMLYGSSMGGIFFDEALPECGDNNQYVDLYRHINDYTKRTHPGAYTVLNPGAPIASCYENTMDTLLTFELDYASYTASYRPNNWVAKDSRKIWHIVYNVPESAVGKVAKLAKDRGAGFLQATNDQLPNPYDTLPSDSYMKKLMAAVQGGTVLTSSASSWRSGGGAGAVFGLLVLASDYTSVKLSWKAASNALGYLVYVGSKVVASVPSSITTLTIGGLERNTSYKVHVSAVGGGGHLGSPSNTITIKTRPLPGGKPITHYRSFPRANSTTIAADILIPYASVHLYIWDSVGCDFVKNPGWSINFKADNYVCTHYMVEGTSLYKYTGTLPKGSTTPPWSWSFVAPVTLHITGHTYIWTLPLGTSTIDTRKFVVQAEGYNAPVDVFQPDPDAYRPNGFIRRPTRSPRPH